MQLTRGIKRQLKVFAVLTTIALGLMVFAYARIPAMVGIGVFDAKANFADASGLYPKALVTYNGVQVGQVSDMNLTPDAAVATMRIDNGKDIPANVIANLRSTSAVGEQFIDLVPPDGDTSEEVMAEGEEIPMERTVEMPQITPVLESVNNLLETVPLEATQAVLDQVDAGLGDSGEDVGRLISSSSTLIGEAQQQIEATTSLIQAARPVLETQRDVGPSTLRYASSLNDFTSELAARDADLRELLTSSDEGLDAATATIGDLQRTLPTGLQNLGVTGTVLNTYLPQLEQTLVVYPPTIARLQSTVNPRAEQGDVKLDLRAALNDPPSCEAGYLEGLERRLPGDTTEREVDTLAHCEEAPAAPPSARGVRNLPCPDSSARGQLPADCGIRFENGVPLLEAGAAPQDPDGATTESSSPGSGADSDDAAAAARDSGSEAFAPAAATASVDRAATSTGSWMAPWVVAVYVVLTVIIALRLRRRAS